MSDPASHRIDDTELASVVRRLADSGYRSVPRILLDLGLWIGAAALALWIDNAWTTIVIAVFIGAFPLHDLLIHGHEATHDLASRRSWLNDSLGWFTLALTGISLTAHREFHLEHHRAPHCARDPEFQLFDRVVKGVPGWAYLLIPFAAAAGIDSYPFRAGALLRVRARVLLELLGAAALHAALLALAGPRAYLWFVVTPMLTGLMAATVLRSVCEHHAVPEGSAWTNARSVESGPVLSFLWSNVNHHLEHHLFPAVPYHELPALRRLLAEEFARRGAQLGRGYLRTAASLLRQGDHFTTERDSSPA